MPVYEYECAQCGPFTSFRPMADYALPHPCDSCGAAAPRAYLTAPALATMNAATRKGMAVNERSRHEPRRSGTHGPGCGCCSPRKPAAARPAAAKTFPGARPWMISH